MTLYISILIHYKFNQSLFLKFVLGIKFVAGNAMATDVDVIQHCPDISVKVYNLTLKIYPSPKTLLERKEVQH